MDKITEGNHVSTTNTMQYKIAIQVQNIQKLTKIVYSFVNSNIDGQSVQTVLSGFPEYREFMRRKQEIVEKYQNVSYSSDFLNSVLMCAVFELARDYVVSHWNQELGSTEKYDKKKMRINMQAADYILEILGKDDYYEMLLDSEVCCEVVRDFDAKARMNTCGIVRYQMWESSFFSGIVSNWFLTTFSPYNQELDKIGGRNRKQMNSDILLWYYGKRGEKGKYENIIQILEQCDNIQYMIFLIHRIDVSRSQYYLYTLCEKHEEGYSDVPAFLQSIPVQSIREVTQSYIRNFKQPKLNLRIFNSVIVGYDPDEYDNLWERYDQNRVLTQQDWQYVCKLYWTLACMEHKTRKFFSIICRQDKDNYQKIKDLLNSSLPKQQLRHDKLHQWMVADSLNIKNSEMCAKLISIAGPEILDFFMSTSDMFLQKIVGISMQTPKDILERVYGNKYDKMIQWHAALYTLPVTTPECWSQDDFWIEIDAM
jgi:hypothetical protein